jgi:hypothetical protein
MISCGCDVVCLRVRAERRRSHRRSRCAVKSDLQFVKVGSLLKFHGPVRWASATRELWAGSSVDWLAISAAGHADGLSSTAWSSTRPRRRPLRPPQALPMASVRACCHLRSTPDSLLTASPPAAVVCFCVRWPPYVQALFCSWCSCALWASRRCTFTCSSRASCARSCGTERWRGSEEASSARERLLPKSFNGNTVLIYSESEERVCVIAARSARAKANRTVACAPSECSCVHPSTPIARLSEQTSQKPVARLRSRFRSWPGYIAA